MNTESWIAHAQGRHRHKIPEGVPMGKIPEDHPHGKSRLKFGPSVRRPSSRPATLMASGEHLNPATTTPLPEKSAGSLRKVRGLCHAAGLRTWRVA